METPSIQVDTFCVHGGPNGNITGIRGNVQCLSEEDLEKDETQLERQEMIKEKCYLRFPTLPFIPKEPYDVIATDYDNFSIVSGAKDRSFIQVIIQLEKTTSKTGYHVHWSSIVLLSLLSYSKGALLLVLKVISLFSSLCQVVEARIQIIMSSYFNYCSCYHRILI